MQVAASGSWELLRTVLHVSVMALSFSLTLNAFALAVFTSVSGNQEMSRRFYSVRQTVVSQLEAR